MTVSSTTNRKTFAGDDATTSFGTSPIVFFDNSDIAVYVTDDATGDTTLLVENTDYTLTGGAGSTGTISLAGGSDPWGALETDTTLVIVRTLPLTQETDLVDNDINSAEVQETALDRLVMIAQQLYAKVSRAFVLADSDVSGASTELPTPEASKVLGWNSSADALQNYSVADIDQSLVSSFGATLIDDADAGEARVTLQVPGYNVLINGSFQVNQAAPTSNADDTYAHDMWYALTQSNAIAVSTVTDAENTTPFMARLTQSNATPQRMGYATIVQGKNCRFLRGQSVTLKLGRLRLSSSANIRMALLEWTGTEDSVTSDVVSDWTSASYTAGGFFLGSSIVVRNVTQQALTAATLTDGTEITATLGSTFNNLIVMVWTESTVAQNVTLDIAKAKLERGTKATLFDQLPYQTEEHLCRRYYQQTFPAGVAPVQNVGNSIGALFGVPGQTNQLFGAQWFFTPAMRSTPSIVTYSPDAASADWSDQAGAKPTRTITSNGTASVWITGATATTAGGQHSIHATASARL